jgi:RNA polymerase sigma-70 factor (ECF subfamily)
VDSGGRYVDEGSSSGRDAVATMLVRAVARCEVEVEEARVNNSPGLVFRRCDDVVAVLAARTLFGRIVDVWVIANPDKLGSWNPRP